MKKDGEVQEEEEKSPDEYVFMAEATVWKSVRKSGTCRKKREERSGIRRKGNAEERKAIRASHW